MLKMKKLLVLLVVLGFVSASSASVVGAVVDIQIAGGGHEITVTPSDTINLVITYNDTTNHSMWNLGVLINVVGQTATLGDMSTGLVFNSALDTTMKTVVQSPPRIVIPALMTAGWGPVGTGSDLVVVSGITMHCDAIGDVVVTLSDYAGDPSSWTDTSDMFSVMYGNGVIIHQVPEPMTLMLLGLGSLFLVRRKK
jgi:hypothetical protein